ncbi:heme-binding protein [Microbacterium sp.]|uniref:heme-binding protein n=1 Tax=Microbacterium sp. TaxID=51671 RepID=UPI002E37B2B0|nr:heme-binding protein [Microbacterium sp.]HEX5730282.1 heme-binding protein [Microbacterium sp.]
MTDLPVFTVADLEAVAAFDQESFDNDDAVALGVIAVEVIRKHAADLAVRIVLRGDAVFVAKLGRTGPGNDPWLAGKAAVAERFAEPSLLVRRRHEEAGTPFADRTDVDHDVFRAHGGSVPIFVGGAVVGTITMSGEPDVVDHAVVAEAIRRYRRSR